MTWAKPKIYYDTMLGSFGSTLTASSIAAGDYSVNYLYNWIEVNSWKAANTTVPMYITYDAGAGNTKQADYLVLLVRPLSSGGKGEYGIKQRRIRYRHSHSIYGAEVRSQVQRRGRDSLWKD